MIRIVARRRTREVVLCEVRVDNSPESAGRIKLPRAEFDRHFRKQVLADEGPPTLGEIGVRFERDGRA